MATAVPFVKLLRQLAAAKDDYRTVPAGCPEQTLKRFRGRLAVVVQQPDPLHAPVVPGAEPQRARDGGAVPGVGVHAEDRVRTEQFGQHGPTPVLAGGIDADRARDRMGLLPYRADQTREQACAVVRNHHEGHDVTQRRGVL